MNFLFTNNRYKKILTGLVFVMVLQFGVLIPRAVEAQVTIVEDLSKIKTETILGALLGALVNGTSYMMRKLAYDGARYIASGGKGQNALAFQDGFGAYLEKTGGESFGAFIEELGEPFGLNLCKPPDIRFQLNLQVSLSRIYDNENGTGGPRAPNCSYQSFVEDWGNIDELYTGDAIAERFNASLSVTQGDFGVALQAQGKLDRNVAKAREASLLERLAGDGFKPVQDIISGDILTPAKTVGEEASALTSKHQAEQSVDQIAGLYGTASWQIIPTTISVFVNTLASTLLDNVLNGGFLPSPSGDGSSGGIVDQFAQQININRKAAEAAYSYLITGQTIREEGTYDTTARFSACPDNPALDNCVIDNDFVRALEEGRAGDPLTIQEAVEKGWLHGNWQLIPPSRTDKNEDARCRLEAYCYSNIQKLRKMRILPLGFEIAALKSDPDRPVTLQEVLDGFNACNDATNPTADPAYPYCHLIDPNWVLKAPTARSEQKVYGPQLFDESLAQRQEEYIDIKTCLQTDEDGRCISYGYCTQEQNTWNIGGTSCPAQFATCQTFTSTEGSRASYLTRTLDYGMCDAESVGCQPFSLERDGDGNWVTSDQASSNTTLQVQTGRNQVAYFNDNIEQYSCPASEDGCNAFEYERPNGEIASVFLKQAPAYLGCYDTNTDTNQIDWPETQSDLALLADVPSQCSNYAGACIASEVGCESYTPSDGSAALTAVAGNNTCSSQCIGYETFRQQKTAFEDSQFPLYFIPNNGQTCSAVDAGCDQFVDLSQSSGEIFAYFTDIVSCRLPDDVAHKTYYTWEGTEGEGFVIKKFELQQFTADLIEYYEDGDYFTLDGTDVYNAALNELAIVGSPRYARQEYDQLSENYALCNETSYNLALENPYAEGAANTDCRKFIDNEGNEYYRLLDELVLIDDACKRYRKVNPNLTQAGSTYTCSNGGYFNESNQTCEYWTLAQAKNTCSAAANQCRSYVGNTGNNIYEVYNNKFEPLTTDADGIAAAKEGWNAETSIEPEATQVGQYSLRVNNSIASYTFPAATFKSGANYHVQFWARGLESLGVSVSLRQGSESLLLTREPITEQDFPAPVSTEWQAYTVGPVGFTLDGNADVTLQFSANSAADYYIDNVRVVSAGGSDLDDYVHIIKNSWKTENGADVPQICDSNPLDQFPGEALGCREYTRRDGQVLPLTGFQNLCRAEAVGCAPLTDIKNRQGNNGQQVQGLEDGKAAYNIFCARSGDTTEQIACSATINGDTVSCDILSGENGCYIEGPVQLIYTSVNQTTGVMSNLATIPEDMGISNLSAGVQLTFVEATHVVASDSDTIYLTQYNLPEDKNYICSQQYVGCQEVAKERKVLPGTDAAAYEFSSGYYTVNNPQHYASTFCVDEQVGCE